MVTFDPAKSLTTFERRGLRFEMVERFEWETAIVNEDTRRDYGEVRLRATGRIDGELYIVVFTQRDDIHVISLRKANNEGATALARKPNPYLIDDENPEWTEEDFGRARPASEVLPPELYARLVARQPGQRGPQKAPTKVPVTLRLDRDVVEAFKADGAGWQTRINSALKKIVARRRRAAKAA